MNFPVHKTGITPLALAEGEEDHENDTITNDITYQFPPPTEAFHELLSHSSPGIEGNSFPRKTQIIVYPLFIGHHQQAKVQFDKKLTCGLGLLMEYG